MILGARIDAPDSIDLDVNLEGGIAVETGEWSGTSETFALPGHGTAPIGVVLGSDS